MLNIVGSSIADFSQGILQNTASTTVTAGPFSLVNFPAGFNTATAFASYSSLGITHFVGTPLVVPAGRGFIGAITLNDPVTCQGSIIANAGNINLNNGLSMSGTASVSLGSGNLTVNDTVSGMNGAGSLSQQALYVGTTKNASFNQSGGRNTMGLYLIVASTPGLSASYSLSGGGQMTVGSEESIGDSGSGSFTQTSGVNNINVLNIGTNAGSSGGYYLSGGQVYLNSQPFESVGVSGNGVFTQTGGTNTTYWLNLGNNAGANGTYNLDGGLLSVALLRQLSGGATFNFNGGTLQSFGGFSTSLPIALNGPGTINTDGNALNIVASITGSGSLTKINNGTLNLESINVYSGGTTVVGGLLAVTVSASLGSGPVNVSAGTLDVTQSPLTIGSFSIGSSGTLNLAIGNPLTVTGTASFGGVLNISGSASGSVIDLMNYSSRTGTFATANVAFGEILQYNATQLDLVPTFQSVGIWRNAASGSWATAGNWTSNTVPNGRNVGVEINAPTASPITITLDGSQTVGALLLGNSASSTTGYTLSGGSGGSLTLDNSGSTATITVTDGNHVISAPLILTAGLTVTPATSATLTISGNVSQTGSTALTLNGPGILVLTGSNGYTGGTTISGGTLQVGTGGSGASIGSTSNVLDNASLVFSHGDGVMFSPPISGSGSLTQAGTGILTLLGSDTYSGSTTISTGTLQVGNGGDGASIRGTSSLLDNASLVFNHGDAVTFSPAISGSGSLTQAGTGILTLLGSNTYSGGTTISAGTLQIGNGGSGTSIAEHWRRRQQRLPGFRPRRWRDFRGSHQWQRQPDPSGHGHADDHPRQ